MRNLVSFAAMAALCAAMASCDRFEPKPVTNQKIGVVAPLTGEGATYGASMRRGFDLAFEDMPNVRVLYEDSKLSARDGVAAFNKLVSVDKVVVVYGDAASGVTTALAPLADEKKIVLFSSISTADQLTNISQYFFRNVPRNALQGQTAVDYIVARGSITRVAILHENDEYGVNLGKVFKARALENGFSVVEDLAYLNTDTDFRSQLTRIKRSGAQAVFIPGNYEESGMILRQAREIGLDATFIGGDGSYSPEIIKYAGPAAEGFVCIVMGVDRSTDMYKSFETKFNAKYGQKPDAYDTYAYEAGLILKQALREGAGDVRGYLAKTTFTTFSGPLKFQGSDMVRPYATAVVRNGAFVE